MRRACLLLLAALLAAPLAAAGSFTLLADRHMEQDAGAEGVTVFAMPVQVNQGGFVYAKILATEGNAVHDGYQANGSVEARTGWRVAFAWIYANATRVELGSFVDGTPTATVPVTPGQTDQLVVTVRWPADAQTVGGAEQVVWTALAFRASADGTGPGATSGVSMDEARALGLTLRFAPGVAMAPAGSNVPPTPAAPSPTTPAPATPPTTPTPGASSPGASGEGSSTGVPPDETGVPPVGPIESTGPGATQVVVVPPVLPTWFLAGILVLAGLAAVGVLAVGVGLVLLARRPRSALRRVTRVPVRAETSKPVEIRREP